MINIKPIFSLGIFLALLGLADITLSTQALNAKVNPNTEIGAEILVETAWGNASVLTKEERIWLTKNQPIRVGIDGNFPPYSYLDEKNEPIGIALDTLALIGEKLDVNFVIDKESTWPNVVANLDAKNIDLILTMVKTPEREANYLFTTPLAYKSLVILNHIDNKTINSRDDIAGKTIALVKNYQYVSKILTEFPSVVPFYVNTMREVLEAVESRQADATITFFAGASFLQQKYLFTDLEFAAFYDRNSANEAIATRSDMPMLAAIMQKGLDAISSDEKLAINEKWHATIALPFNYQLAIEITLVAGLLIGLLLLWLLREKRHNKALVVAKIATEEANSALNALREKLEIRVSERTVQLQKSESQYRGLVKSLQDEYVFYQHNVQGEILYVSPSITHILGYKTLSFIGVYNKYLTDNQINLAIPQSHKTLP